MILILGGQTPGTDVSSRPAWVQVSGGDLDRLCDALTGRDLPTDAAVKQSTCDVHVRHAQGGVALHISGYGVANDNHAVASMTVEQSVELAGDIRRAAVMVIPVGAGEPANEAPITRTSGSSYSHPIPGLLHTGHPGAPTAAMTVSWRYGMRCWNMPPRLVGAKLPWNGECYSPFPSRVSDLVSKKENPVSA